MTQNKSQMEVEENHQKQQAQQTQQTQKTNQQQNKMPAWSQLEADWDTFKQTGKEADLYPEAKEDENTEQHASKEENLHRVETLQEECVYTYEYETHCETGHFETEEGYSKEN